MKWLCNELNFTFKPIVAGFVNVEKLIKYKSNKISAKTRHLLRN